MRPCPNHFGILVRDRKLQLKARGAIFRERCPCTVFPNSGLTGRSPFPCHHKKQNLCSFDCGMSRSYTE